MTKQKAVSISGHQLSSQTGHWSMLVELILQFMDGSGWNGNEGQGREMEAENFTEMKMSHEPLWLELTLVFHICCPHGKS